MSQISVSLNTHPIIADGLDCLKNNGYILSLNDISITLQDNDKSFVMIAIATKEGKKYTFKMLLDDNFFVCIEDDTKLDMTKYKKNDSFILESIQNTEERINNRTPLEWVKLYSDNLKNLIELNKEDSTTYNKESFERDFKSLVESAKKGDIIFTYFLDTDDINNLVKFLSPESANLLRDIK